MRARILSLIAALLLAACAPSVQQASAQSVTVIGPVTPGDLPQFNSPTVLKDSGIPAASASPIVRVPDQFCTVDRTGASDMGPCINSAITASSSCGAAGFASLYLRAGTYLITTPLVPKSCMNIVGDGSGKTILLTNTAVPFAGAAGAQLVHFQLRGVTFSDSGNVSLSTTAGFINSGGTGYGNNLTGTMTWSGAGCSVNPVLNVTTNGSGVITTVNSVTTPGACTSGTFPQYFATTRTPGGGLSAGSNASFALVSSGKVMSFINLQGSEIRDIEFKGYYNGTLMNITAGTVSSFSDTSGIWSSTNSFFNNFFDWYVPATVGGATNAGCATCIVLGGTYGSAPTGSPPNSSNQPSTVLTRSVFRNINIYGFSVKAFNFVKAVDSVEIKTSTVWLGSNNAIVIQYGDDYANFPGNNYVSTIKAEITTSLIPGVSQIANMFRVGDWTYGNVLDYSTDVDPANVTNLIGLQGNNVTLAKFEQCGANPFVGYKDPNTFNSNRLCYSHNYGSADDGEATYNLMASGSAALPSLGYFSSNVTGFYLANAFSIGLSNGTGFRFNGSSSGGFSITPSATGSPQYGGTATNDNAPAGGIGEAVSATVNANASVAIGNGVPKSYASISLTAGDWDVWSVGVINPDGSTVTTAFGCWTFTTADAYPVAGGVLDSQGSYSFNRALDGAGAPTASACGTRRYSLSGTTTVFATCIAGFSGGNNGCYGFIGARRRR